MIIKSTRIWDGENFIPDSLFIEDGKIIDRKGYDVEADFDYSDSMIWPGFIDIHTHGGFGTDIMATDPNGIRTWMKEVTKLGTTSLLATTFTDSHDNQIKAIKNVMDVLKNGYEGAEILGFNYEGPYLNKVYAGGQPEQYIVDPNIEEYDKFNSLAEGHLKVISVAVEKDEGFKFCDHIKDSGVIISAGHTNATYEEIEEARSHGLRNMTHTYNCMSPLHHRKPGCVGAAYLFDDLYTELICDGSMVSVQACKVLFKMKPQDKVIMITDSLACQGMNQPGYQFDCGGFWGEVLEDGSVVEVGTGMFLGSTLGMNSIVKTAVKRCGVDFKTAVMASSLNAATLLDVADRKGRLEKGYDADIVVLDDDFNVIQTYCLGKRMIGE
jgi:N-acetylglucosamine-6-phosphate deacetylase